MTITAKKALTPEQKRENELIDAYGKALATAAQSQLYKDLLTQPEFVVLVRTGVAYVLVSVKQMLRGKKEKNPSRDQYMSAAFMLGFVLGRITQETVPPQKEETPHVESGA